MKNKFRINKTIIICLALAVVGVAVFVVNYLMPANLPAFKAQKTSMDDYCQVTGTMSSQENMSLVAGTSGSVIKVHVDVNDTVEQGDVIAEISAADYEAEKAVKEAELLNISAQIDAAVKNGESRKMETANKIDILNNQAESLKNQYLQSKINAIFDVPQESKLEIMQTNYENLQKTRSNLQKEYDDYKSAYDYIHDMIADNEDLSKLEKTTRTNELNRESVDNKYRSLIETDAQLELDWKKFADAVEKLHALAADGIYYGALDKEYERLIEADYNNRLEAVNLQIDYLTQFAAIDTVSLTIESLNSQAKAINSQIAALEEKIAGCTIKSPFSGVIRELPVKNLNMVNSTDVVATVWNTSEMLVQCDVLTKYVSGISNGDAVTLIHKTNEGNKEYKGTIEKIYDYASQSTSSLGLNEYKVKVLIKPEEALGLRSGSDIEVKFTVYHSEDVLKVPVSAILSENDRYYVYAFRNGKLEKQEVTVKYRSNEYAEISDVIVEGDVVVKNAYSEEVKEGISAKADIGE